MWLLTEVHPEVAIPGMKGHRTADLMNPRKTWAAIFSTDDTAIEPDPHRATVMACIDGFRVMSSVLPWRSCGLSWEGTTLAEKLSATLAAVAKCIYETTVWGGDWNQALEVSEYVGSLDGRRQIVELAQQAGLCVPTTTLRGARRGTGPSTTSRSQSTGMSMPLIALPRGLLATDCLITTRM